MDISPADIVLRAIGFLMPASYRSRLSAFLLEARRRSQLPVPFTPTRVFAFSAEAKRLFAPLLAEEPAAHGRPAYSVVCTFRNEESCITALLDSLLHQTAVPNDVVLCDGGSTDGTLRAVRAWDEQTRAAGRFHLRLIAEGPRSIAAGRNRAAREASTDILVFADAGTSLEANWAERLLLPFVADPETGMSMGWYRPITRSAFQAAAAHFLVPKLNAVDPPLFLPSARSLAVRKAAFEAVGGFPEHLSLAGEDSLFDFYLKTAVRSAAFVPDGVVHWDFPHSLRKLARTVHNYARGDGESGFLFWAYYLRLLECELKIVIELALGLGFAGAGWALNAAALPLFTLSGLSGAWGLLRAARLLAGYSPWAGEALTFRDKFQRLLGLGVMVICQGSGFTAGLFSRPAVESRRISSARAGHVVFFLSEFFRYLADQPGKDEILERLQAGWYVTIVYAQSGHTPSAEQPLFAHPHLEQHLRSAFAPEAWHLKHSPYVGKGAGLQIIDRCEDALSRAIIEKLGRLL